MDKPGIGNYVIGEINVARASMERLREICSSYDIPFDENFYNQMGELSKIQEYVLNEFRKKKL